MKPPGERNPADRSRADRAIEIRPALFIPIFSPAHSNLKGTFDEGLALPSRSPGSISLRYIIHRPPDRISVDESLKSDLGIDPLHSLFESEGQSASIYLAVLNG